MPRARRGTRVRSCTARADCFTGRGPGIPRSTEESTEGGMVSTVGGYDDGGGSRAGTAYADRPYMQHGRGMGFGGGGYGRQRQSYPVETKPFFLTSEFLFPLLAWFGL